MKHLASVPSPLDPLLLRGLRVLERSLLLLVGAIGLAQLLFWLWPRTVPVVPGPWTLMKANTALGLLLLAVALSVGQRQPRIAAFAAGLVLLLALATLGEYSGLALRGLDNWLATDPAAQLPGRMAWQTAFAFALLAVQVLLRIAPARRLVRIADLLLLALLAFVLTLAAGYVYGALEVYGISNSLRTAPQTLLALLMLVAVISLRRLPQSPAGVLLGAGHAGQVGRIVLPIALLLPLLVPALRLSFGGLPGVDVPIAAALAGTLHAALATFAVVWMARRIDRFESELRRLSLLDELTGVHNRRGFMLLARHALRMARRDKEVVSVVFIDVDHLKRVNDQFGHDAGSELLRAVAGLLEQTFRDSDVVGRFGGDEFCVLALGANAADAQKRIAHLQSRISDFNQRHRQPYAIGCSVGVAQLAVLTTEGLDHALREADAAMYRDKAAKKAWPAAA